MLSLCYAFWDSYLSSIPLSLYASFKPIGIYYLIITKPLPCVLGWIQYNLNVEYSRDGKFHLTNILVNRKPFVKMFLMQISLVCTFHLFYLRKLPLMSRDFSSGSVMPRGHFNAPKCGNVVNWASSVSPTILQNPVENISFSKSLALP